MSSVVMQSDEEFYLIEQLLVFSVDLPVGGIFVSQLINTLNTPTNNRFLKPAEYALSGS